MYLGMTEDEYESVYDATPLMVGKRLGLASSQELSQDKLLDLIQKKDYTVFTIMENFRTTYSEWWALSKKIAETENSDIVSMLRSQLKNKIFERDEIRKALVSYLNFKYGKYS